MKKANQCQVTWSELGENLQQLVAPESDAAPTTLANCSTAKSQEEAVSYYTQANSQLKLFVGARIPPPAKKWTFRMDPLIIEGFSTIPATKTHQQPFPTVPTTLPTAAAAAAAATVSSSS
jgi:hypothetical protein